MTTLTQYRREAAKAMGTGRFVTGTADSGSSTTTLVDAALRSSLNQNDLYSDFYLFRPNSVVEDDKVRVVATYTPASGYLVVDRVWSAAPYAGSTGEAYELHGIIEPYETLRELINDALKRCYILTEFTITPVEDQQRHSLTTAAPWLTDPNAILQVGWLKTTDDRDEEDPFAYPIRGEVVQDGATYYLTHRGRTFNASDDLIYCQAVKPAYYHCRASGGTYGEQSGLTLETDECPVNATWVASATLIEAWRTYAHMLEAAANQKLLRDRQEAAAWFSRLTTENFRLPSRRLRKPAISWGPRW